MAIKLISQGEGEYLSEDGRIHVVLDHTFETECDIAHSHPVRIRVDTLNRWWTPEAIEKLKAEYGKKVTSKWSKREKKFIEYISWQCQGGESHYYSMWTTEIDGDWTEIVTDKFTTTVGELEALLGEEIKVVHPRKPKVEPELDPDSPTFVYEDELRAIKEALVRYDELMASDDAPYVDQKLHAWHLARKAELEAMLAAAA